MDRIRDLAVSTKPEHSGDIAEQHPLKQFSLSEIGAALKSLSPGRVPTDFGNIILVADAAKDAPTADVAAKPATTVKVPRLDAFDRKKEPADHMRCDADKRICGSSRIMPGEKNLLGIVAFDHKGEPALNSSDVQERDAALADAAKKTSVFDFRTYDDKTLDAATLKVNNFEMSAEKAAADALGVHYETFAMDSKEPQTPKRLMEIVDAMQREHDLGNTVSIHCYHGTDRTGLVLAAYEATHDARLIDQLKNQGQKGVDETYNELKKQLLDSGVEPSTHAAIFQSMRQFLQYQHDGSNFDVVAPVQEQKIDDAQRDLLKAAHEALVGDPTMNGYMSVLKSNIDKYDPAEYGAMYRQLYRDFDAVYKEKHAAQ